MQHYLSDEILRKETSLKMVEIKIDHDKCDGCGTCKDTCPTSVFEINDGKSKVVNLEACLVCRACEVQCPKGAIQVIE